MVCLSLKKQMDWFGKALGCLALTLHLWCVPAGALAESTPAVPEPAATQGDVAAQASEAETTPETAEAFEASETSETAGASEAEETPVAEERSEAAQTSASTSPTTASSEPKTENPSQAFDLPAGPTGKAAESGLKSRLMKFALVLLGIVALMYVIFYGFRRTPMYKQMATNPVRVKSVTPTGGKTKLLMVEAYGSHLLLSANEQSLSLIKEFEPHRIRQYEFEKAEQEAAENQEAFESAMQKAVGKSDEKTHDAQT